jgi:Fur family ferric uptake transcriptional regulator
LICTKCGRISEFRDEEMEILQAKIAASQRFHILQHKMEIYGLCSQCVSQRSPLMPLAAARPGERLVIADIMGGRHSRERLAFVGHGTTRLALGRGMAQKIMVSLPKQDPDEFEP